MTPKYFDIHSHLNFPDYDEDREVVIERLKETNTHTMVVGTDFESSKKAVELADKHEEIYACIGIHPADDVSASWEGEKFDKLISSPKVVAVGECGLDFFRTPRSLPRHGGGLGEVGQKEFERQKELFLAQVNFAIAHDKPIMIHARNAYEELLEVLEPLGHSMSKLRGNVHFFAGDIEIAKRFIDIDFTLSFTGVITFVRDYDEVIKFAPLSMIISETDAPLCCPSAVSWQTQRTQLCARSSEKNCRNPR
ncbi:MAG: TatD family hydrolase [bacterium]